MLPIATAVPNSPVMKKAITAVVNVAVTRQVKAFDTLLALESTSFIEAIHCFIIFFESQYNFKLVLVLLKIQQSQVTGYLASFRLTNLALNEFNQFLCILLNGVVFGVQNEFWLPRCFIGTVDPREVGKLPCPCLSIKALWVASFSLTQ